MTNTNDIEISAPTPWNSDQVANWANLGDGSRHLVSVFGSRQTQTVGHGRAPRDVAYVSDAAIVENALAVRKHGLKFLYLLNGRCEHLDFSTVEVRRSVERDIEWIVEDVKADAVVIADLRVATLLRARYDHRAVAIRVSTIAGVRNFADLTPWLELAIDGVVLHHDCGRDFSGLAEIRANIEQHAPNVKVELLLNETCLPGCRVRSAHYARLARETLEYSEAFQQTCNLPKFRAPAFLLMPSWIRPEDMPVYRNIGISRFKIAGREMPADWLESTVRAYLNGTYDGNLFDLLTMTPPELTTTDIVHLQNSSLQGFLDDLMNSQGMHFDTCCRWARTLWMNGSLRVADPGSDYSLRRDGGIRCQQRGIHQRHLVDLQANRDSVFGHSKLRPERAQE